MTIPLHTFIQEFYQTSLITYDYSDVINKNGLNGLDNTIHAIDDADLELLGAILTRLCESVTIS